jgi:hypothetical protein
MRLVTLPLVAVLALGCASVEARSTDSLLENAGFRTVAANTPERIELLKTLPARKVSPVDRNGQVFYVYSDPDGCRCLRVGRQEQYEVYQRLQAGKQETTLGRTRTDTGADVLKGFDK